MITMIIEVFMSGKISFFFSFPQDTTNLNIRSTHNDEMCNIYAMYSYDPSKKSRDSSITQMCWDNEFSKMAK